MALVKPKVGAAKKKFEFNYTPRTAEQMKKRATASGLGRDSFVREDVKLFNPKEGDHRVRIMPPTWEGADHFGLTLRVHYGIGPDNVGYLCLHGMKREECALCSEKQDADRAGEEDLAKALRVTPRMGYWIIDRKNEGDGPKFWPAPFKNVDKEICAQAVDDDNAVVALDSPDEGFDITFRVEGQGITKQYTGIKVARKPSPLSDDDDKAMEWLQYITDNPLPEILVFHDNDHMLAAYSGKSNKSDKDEADEKPEKPAKPSKQAAAASGGKPKIGAGKPKIGTKPEPEPEPDQGGQQPTWEEVHAMDEDELTALAEANDIDFGDESFASVEEVADWLCEKLGVEQDGGSDDDQEEEEAPAKPSLKDRLKGLGKKK